MRMYHSIVHFIYLLHLRFVNIVDFQINSAKLTKFDKIKYQ